MIRSILLGGAVALTLATPSVFAQATGQALPTQAFITAAAQTDEFERREGRLAETQAEDPKVKAFGAKMVKAHTMTTQKLKMAIREAGMTVPPPPPLTDDQKQMLKTLRGLHGADFDKTYIDQQVQVHQMALGVMQAEAAGGSDPTIRQAAANTAPIVQDHLTMAQALQSQGK